MVVAWAAPTRGRWYLKTLGTRGLPEDSGQLVRAWCAGWPCAGSRPTAPTRTCRCRRLRLRGWRNRCRSALGAAPVVGLLAQRAQRRPDALVVPLPGRNGCGDSVRRGADLFDPSSIVRQRRTFPWTRAGPEDCSQLRDRPSRGGLDLRASPRGRTATETDAMLNTYQAPCPTGTFKGHIWRLMLLR